MDTTPSNTPSTPHTPNATVYGSLVITAGLCIVLFALGEKARTACIIGGAVTVAGFILVLIGNRQKKRQATKTENANA